MELQEAYPAIRGEGAELLAISVDALDRAIGMAQYAGAQFPVLADTDTSVTRRYGVFNLLGDGVSAPATFIVGSDGAIAWRHVGENIADRPAAAELLRELRQVVASP